MSQEEIRGGRLETADSFHLSLSDQDKLEQAELGVAAQQHESKWKISEGK